MMKKHNRLLIGLATASLLMLSSGANAAVKGSLHDLSAATGSGTVAAPDNICVFCHTPHGSADPATSPAPLWNKNVPAAATFTNYDDAGTSATMDGTADLTSSVSLACLSCHDGTQAVDSVLNAPGSGGYDATGAQTIDTGAVTMATISGTDPIPNLGQDLSNDHPVSMEYAGGGATYGTAYADGALTDTAFRAITVTAGKSFADDTINQLPLYNKGGTAFVECASCHDPHDAAGLNETFLRVSNAGSAVCVTCHIK